MLVAKTIVAQVMVISREMIPSYDSGSSMRARIPTNRSRSRRESMILSLRAFDVAGMLLDADIIEGRDVDALIERLFANRAVKYIHAHNAKQGCYAGRIDRG
ncbi:MAG: DUF1203 domain-containing protein [Alphaproteobacteria bacterium]|jgi:hypothetical protein|nr:DUF1203 domain-containing protein [Alphaproteobacteria bacterium]